MIAKVRISPVARWCQLTRNQLKDFPASAVLIGRWIEIIPESMGVDVLMNGVLDEPGTRSWLVSEKTRQEFIAVVREDRGYMVCEHMLEIGD